MASQRDEDLRELPDLLPALLGSIQPGVGPGQALLEELGYACASLVVGMQAFVLADEAGVGLAPVALQDAAHINGGEVQLGLDLAGVEFRGDVRRRSLRLKPGGRAVVGSYG